MKIIVRKMPNMVLDGSFGQIDGKFETCFAGNAMETFVKSVELSQGGDCLNMEDDIILCNDFLVKINDAVDRYPDRVVSFFTLKNVSETTEKAGGTFCMAQCVYIPKRVNAMLLGFYPLWAKTKRGIENPTGCDYMIGDLLSKIGEKYVLHVPCLVQHMDMKSRIDPRRSTKRQTKLFYEV